MKNDNNRLLLIISIIFLVNVVINAQNYNVIVDTDGALDDIRAITMLLAIDEVEIEAIVTCGGTLSSRETKQKVCDLIRYFKESDKIVIAEGIDNEINPPWRSFNQSIKLSEGNNKFNYKEKLFSELNSNVSDTIIYLCLGPLSNLASIIKEQIDLKNKIEKLIWYCGNEDISKAFNFKADSISAKLVLDSGLEIDIINGRTLKNDISFLFNDGDTSNIFSSFIVSLHKRENIQRIMSSGHFGLWDDLVPVYLLYPEFFKMRHNIMSPKTKHCISYDTNLVNMVIPLIYSQQYTLNKQIVYSELPMVNELYRYDVQLVADEILKKYGKQEWKACVITNEFHGHLGIYSIVGAKMGIKALNILNAPIDKVKVVSFAGNRPPVSCFTDGLQVSTGATLGQGLISISDELEKRPEAIFTYNNTSVRIKLKQEIWYQIKEDISKGIVEYGLLSDGYWTMIRRQAIEYWLDFDRDKIFEITELKN